MEVGMCAPDVSPHPWATQITPCPMHPVSRVDRLLPEMLNVSRTAWYSCCSHSMRAVGQAEVLKDHVANTSNKICVSGRPSTGSGPGEKKFSAPPPRHSKGEPAKNLYNKSEILSAAGWLGLDLKGANLCNGQITVLPREIKTYATYWGPRPR